MQLLDFGDWIRRAVARRAILGCGLIEENSLRCDYLGHLVALRASHVLMRSSQWERRAFLVIEQRRLPLHAVVALGTSGYVGLRELLAVNVLVTLFTLHRRRFEIDVDQLGLKIRGLVAVFASCRTVRPKQRKLRLRMIKPGKVFPRLGCVASFAARPRTVSPHLLHALLELPLVRINMATGARQILPVINHRRLGLELRRLLVTFGARNRDVAARQCEVSFFMLGQSERRRFVTLQRVAAIARIEIRRGRKL